MLTLVDGSLLI